MTSPLRGKEDGYRRRIARLLWRGSMIPDPQENADAEAFYRYVMRSRAKSRRTMRSRLGPLPGILAGCLLFAIGFLSSVGWFIAWIGASVALFAAGRLLAHKLEQTASANNWA
jgi:hypothetical protein